MVSRALSPRAPRKARRRLWARLVAPLAFVLLAQPAHAAGKKGPPPQTKAAAHAKQAPKPSPAEKPARPRGKVAVLAFAGESAGPVQREVVRVLQNKGLRLLFNIRTVDSPGQFREMADALKVFAYVTGSMEMQGAEFSATVEARSGATGLRIASVTFFGERKKVLADLGKGLWDAFAPALARASADAQLPHEHEAPMRIDAGSPIENTAEEESAAPSSAAAGKTGPL